MQGFLLTATAVVASLLAAVPAQAREEVEIAVPGFADFLAVDGDSVWATNRGKVERWSLKGKLAEVPITHPCGGMSVAFGALWVADCGEGTVKRIDLATARVVATIATGIANAQEGELNVAAGAGAVWVASDRRGGIARIDPRTNTVVSTIPTVPGAWYLAFGEGALWAVSARQNIIQRIDPAANVVTKTTALGRQPGFLAAGEGAVWVQEQGDGTVARIDPASGEVTGRVKVGATLLYGDIDTGAGKVWLRTTEDQTFVAIDSRTLAIEGRYGKLVGSGGLRRAPTGVWTSAHDRHTLSWWPDAPVK
jgi:DNA-binding beta-propeller fold protein YncE